MAATVMKTKMANLFVRFYEESMMYYKVTRKPFFRLSALRERTGVDNWVDRVSS